MLSNVGQTPVLACDKFKKDQQKNKLLLYYINFFMKLKNKQKTVKVSLRYKLEFNCNIFFYNIQIFRGGSLPVNPS